MPIVSDSVRTVIGRAISILPSFLMITCCCRRRILLSRAARAAARAPLLIDDLDLAAGADDD